MTDPPPTIRATGTPLCPSARPEMAGSLLHGVVLGTVEEPRMAPLREPVPVTAEHLKLGGSVAPTEVFRFAAPCAATGCQHFDGSDCRLAQRVVKLMPIVTQRLPPCRIRPHCRWWQQEGKAACLRCPAIVTDTCQPSELMQLTARVDARDDARDRQPESRKAN